MYLSGAREESSEPISTAGTLPTMIDGDAELHVPERQRAEGRRRGERDRLGQVGADQLARGQQRGR